MTTEESTRPKPTGFYYPETADVFYGDDGRTYHNVRRMTEGGTSVITTRPLAKTIEEARENRWDFYSPTLGLIWDGYKLAGDRSPQSRIRDTSESIPKPGTTTLA